VSASKRHRKLVDAFRPKPARMISAEQASEHSGAFRASDAKDYWVTFEQRVSVVCQGGELRDLRQLAWSVIQAG
jgi:hypothetical protein